MRVMYVAIFKVNKDEYCTLSYGCL